MAPARLLAVAAALVAALAVAQARDDAFAFQLPVQQAPRDATGAVNEATDPAHIAEFLTPSEIFSVNASLNVIVPENLDAQRARRYRITVLKKRLRFVDDEIDRLKTVKKAALDRIGSTFLRTQKVADQYVETYKTFQKNTAGSTIDDHVADNSTFALLGTLSTNLTSAASEYAARLSSWRNAEAINEDMALAFLRMRWRLQLAIAQLEVQFAYLPWRPPKGVDTSRSMEV